MPSFVCMSGEHKTCKERGCNCQCHFLLLDFTCVTCDKTAVVWMNRAGIIYTVKNACDHLREAQWAKSKVVSKEGTALQFGFVGDVG